jgi:hypothetical protein
MLGALSAQDRRSRQSHQRFAARAQARAQPHSSAKPREMVAAARSPEAGPIHHAAGDGVDVLPRPQQRTALRVSRLRAEPARPRLACSRARRASRAAMVTAVGRQRATSRAKERPGEKWPGASFREASRSSTLVEQQALPDLRIPLWRQMTHASAGLMRKRRSIASVSASAARGEPATRLSPERSASIRRLPSMRFRKPHAGRNNRFSRCAADALDHLLFAPTK